MPDGVGGGDFALIVTIGKRACAIPLAHVTETLRPLAIEPIAGTPPFVRGVSVIRGAAVPVVDLKALLEGGENSVGYGRFVTVKSGERTVAVAVDGVVGVRELHRTQLEELPPILRDVSAELIDTIGILDSQLLLVLRAARLVPNEVWANLAAGEVAP